MRLPAEQRPAWLNGAREHLAEQHAERDAQRLAHARGQLTLPGADVASLRRRREASRRLEPLPDGRRDPLDKTPAKPGLRTLHVEVGKHTAWLYGEKTVRLLERAGVVQRQWDWQRRVWMVPVQYADDVITYAEWRERRVVTVEAVDR